MWGESQGKRQDRVLLSGGLLLALDLDGDDDRATYFGTMRMWSLRRSLSGVVKGRRMLGTDQGERFGGSPGIWKAGVRKKSIAMCEFSSGQYGGWN